MSRIDHKNVPFTRHDVRVSIIESDRRIDGPFRSDAPIIPTELGGHSDVGLP